MQIFLHNPIFFCTFAALIAYVCVFASKGL